MLQNFQAATIRWNDEQQKEESKGQDENDDQAEQTEEEESAVQEEQAEPEEEEEAFLPCSRGMAIVCDTGTFALSNPYQLDIAVTW